VSVAGWVGGREGEIISRPRGKPVIALLFRPLLCYERQRAPPQRVRAFVDTASSALAPLL